MNATLNEFELLIMAVSTNNYNTILDENLIRRPEYILSLYYILTYKL